jgi:predicted ATPase/DNA-binding XRE family transcriptional regulator
VTEDIRRPYREFGAWLRSRRLARRWTQEHLARRLGYNVTYIRKLEWGERRPSEPLRIRLSQVLDVPVSSLPPSRPVVGHRLPDTPGPLLGREADVEAVLSLYDRGVRLVTLVGAPGIGKTRLAVELARRLDDRYAGGARFVSLTGLADGAEVIRPIAEAVDVRWAIGGEAIDRIVDALDSQEILLVLDNFEHVLSSAPVVGELLARAPAVRVLATSREPLELRPEVQYSLPPLRVPPLTAFRPEDVAGVPSVELFVAGARRARPEFSLSESNAEAVALICRRLDGIPLAIELAASAMRLLSPGALLAQVDHGLDLLPAGPRDAPDHHRTLRAAIQWSFDRLATDEQTLLSRLAVFVGGCTIDAAAAVCRLADDEHQIEPRTGLLGLARKSLLEPVTDPSGGTRFVALEAVRQMALERLVASGDAERVRRCHAEWFVSFAESQEPGLVGAGQVHALAALDAEHGNLRTALAWSLEHAPAMAARFGAALWRFWWIRGHLDEGRSWLDKARAHPPTSEFEAGPHARATMGAGVLARTQGAYEVAAELLEVGGARARALGDRRGLALSLINLGIVAADQADHVRALAHFEESRRLSEAIGDLRGAAHSLNCEGGLRLGQGDLEAARELFERALDIFRDAGDDWSTAMVLANLGWVAHKQARDGIARMLYEKSLAIYRALGDDRNVAHILLKLGTQGDRSVSDGLLEEALLIFSRLGERRCVAQCLDALAVARASSDPERAASLLAASESLRSRIGATRWPDDQAVYDRARRVASRQLSEAAFEVAWEAGRIAEPDEMIALAMARPAEAPDAPE